MRRSEVDLLFTQAGLTSAALEGTALVVFDVLRWCTTVCHALTRGAGRVIPVGGIAEATRVAANLDRDATLLCGEREARRIEGFHLGNSPREYTREVVQGKTLVMSTSNGTQAVERAAAAQIIALGALVNVSAVARWAAGRREPLLLVCAGTGGRFALEDAVAAGLLVGRLRALAGGLFAFRDAAGAAERLADSHREDLRGMLGQCEHGRTLARLGHADDLAVCGALDTLEVVPLVVEGRIGRPETANGT